MKWWASKLWAICLIGCTAAQVARAQQTDAPATPSTTQTQNVYTYTDYRWGARNVYAGAEATFLAPIFGANSSSLIQAADVAGATFTNQSGTSSSSQLGFAPRVWVGAGMDDGYGIRLRFWDLNTSSLTGNAIDFTNPASVGLSNGSQFSAYTVDLELTRELYLQRSVAMTSFGCRTAGINHIDRQTNTLVAPTATDLLFASATTSNSFYGTGLTSATQWMRPFYQGAFGNMSLYASGRGSVLWGNDITAVSTQAGVFGPGIAAASTNGVSTNLGNTMWIGELQAGLQWNKVLTTFYHTRAFARIAFEYQNWGLNTANSARAFSFATRPGVDIVTSSALAGSLQNLSLIGFGISTGFYW